MTRQFNYYEKRALVTCKRALSLGLSSIPLARDSGPPLRFIKSLDKNLRERAIMFNNDYGGLRGHCRITPSVRGGGLVGQANRNIISQSGSPTCYTGSGMLQDLRLLDRIGSRIKVS